MDTPMPEQDHAESARIALRAASAAESRLHRRGLWERGYLLGFAVALVPLVPLIGLGGRVATGIGLGVWTAVAITLALWSRFRSVTPRGQQPRSGRAFATWASLYAVTLAVGLPGYPGDPTFWFIAAVIVPLPLVIAAFWPSEPVAARP
ncbi:MAG TPA: hypothetical protein VGP26_17095 [Actinophytocola sp.]|jgi:hypothetical protein|nr:hypothetical protein [Actinophytocola sp.]